MNILGTLVNNVQYFSPDKTVTKQINTDFINLPDCEWDTNIKEVLGKPEQSECTG